MATEGLLPLRKKKKKKNAPLPKGVTENRQPYNVFEEEKIMQSAAEAMREMRSIERGAELSSKLVEQVGNTKLGQMAGDSLVGQVAGAAFSEVNNLRLKRAKKKRKRARARTSFTEQLKEVVGLGPEPTDSKWVKLHMNRGEESSEAGEVLMSIELLPRTLANELAAGNGRSEPNDHPQLGPPVGRFDPTQLFNPLYALQQVHVQHGVEGEGCTSRAEVGDTE